MNGAPRFAAAVFAALGVAPLAAQKDLEALVEQLGSSDATVRSRAYSTLQRDRRVDVVDLLGKRIDGMLPEGQQLALYLLQQHPIDATRPVYTRLLAAERPLLRASAAAMLVRSGDRARMPVLAKAVAAAPRDERQSVLNVLWSIDDPSIVEAVRGYVTAEASAPLLVSALAQLRQIEKGRSPATTAAVRALAASPTAEVRAAALAWLCGGDGGDGFATELAQLLREDGSRFWIVERLFERDRKYPAVLTDAFAAALASPRSQYDVTQAAALLKVQAPELVGPALRALLDHANDGVRTAAMQALATVPGGLEGKELQKLLQEGSPEQQLAAAAVLRRMDDSSGLPVVLQLLQSRGKHTAEAVRVLAGFRSRDVVEPLLAALDDAELPVRQAAWTGLQQVLRDLFPYRRFAFDRSGYDPNGGNRTAGIQQLRTWWVAVR